MSDSFEFQRGSLRTYYLICHLSLALSIGSALSSGFAKSFPIYPRGHIETCPYCRFVGASRPMLLSRQFYLHLGLFSHVVMGLSPRFGSRAKLLLCRRPFTTKLRHGSAIFRFCVANDTDSHWLYSHKPLQRETVQRTQLGFPCG